MAILGKGILDGFKGKMDGLVGQKRNGHSTISQHRDGDTINWSVQTDNQRTRMSLIRGVYGSFSTSQVQYFFNIGDSKSSKFFKFVKRNYKNSTTSSFMPASDFDGDSFLGLPVPLPNLITVRVGSTSNYRWNPLPLQPNWDSTDRMRCMIYDPLTNRFRNIQTGALRSAGSVIAGTNTFVLGQTVYVMMSVRRLDNSHTSRWVIFPKVVQP